MKNEISSNTHSDGFFEFIRYDKWVVVNNYIGNETEVTIPSSVHGYPVASISSYAFADNLDIVSITLPESLVAIDDFAFWGCRSLVTVNLPETLETIGKYAFKGCLALKNIQLPKTLKEIGTEAFSACFSLESIIVPDKVTNLTYGIFMGCFNLRTIEFEGVISSIGIHVFNSCVRLESCKFHHAIEKDSERLFSTTSIQATPEEFEESLTSPFEFRAGALEDHSNVEQIKHMLTWDTEAIAPHPVKLIVGSNQEAV